MTWCRNCPKYINVRDLVPFSATHPRVVHRRLDLSPNERLPEEVVSFIHDSDTLFLGTYYDAGDDAERFPSHVGMNHRGGKPGFARIQPSDGRTLVIPDYSGMPITRDALGPKLTLSARQSVDDVPRKH